MSANSCCCAAVLTLAAAVARAEAPTFLGTDDVYFQYRPAHSEAQHTGSNVNGQLTYPVPALCGFSIRGNHRSKADPHTEWDINIDEVVARDARVAGITAGTFDVVGHTRKPRAPIVELTFTIDNGAVPIPAQLVGTPNASNAITAMLETQAAKTLFTALSDQHLVTVSFKYADGSAEQVQFKSWHDQGKFATGQNSMFNQCLAGFVPFHNIQSPMP